ncbi:MAG: DNA polymerase III subunit alpha [Methanomassiliicoccales archaeon]|jgi:DNA polymerase-3 subunit alpha
MAFENFAQLHNHSHFSLLDGLATVEDLVECAIGQKYKALALTDHGTCAGLLQFYKACKKDKQGNPRNIKPILGLETYITDDLRVKEKGVKHYHLILLAKNKVGYKNLIYLSSLGYLSGFYYKPRIDFNALASHKEGLIVSTACNHGEIPSLLWNDNESKAREIALKYKDTFGDDFYIEIMLHKYHSDPKQELKEKKLAGMLYRLANSVGVKAICTTDAHYAHKSDADAHDVLVAMQTHDVIKNPDRMSFHSDDFYLKSPLEMEQQYRKTPDLLRNVEEIVEKIEPDVMAFGDDLLPIYVVPTEFKSDIEYLKALVTDGMKLKGLINKPMYRERVKMEMSVIEKCGYTRYFLILWDIINFANEHDIRVGIGRGSAVSSLALYVLGVTKLDPLKYGLIFERFLNPDRISPPDVDVDFDYFRRDEIFDYIIRKYGADRCAKIGTYNSFKARAVIRYTAKALDIGNDWERMQNAKKRDPNAHIESTKFSLQKADELAKLIPEKPGTTLADAVRQEEAFRSAMKQYPKLMESALAIEGTLSSSGVHPAGIVVCKNPIVEHVPLRVNKGVTCCQLDGPEVEELGLLKFDLLALKTLTVVDKTIKMVKLRHGIDIDIDNIEPNDQNVFKIFNGTDPKRDTRGIFQFEGYGISKLLREIRVDSFEDLIVANALYRPGPLGAGVHHLYCDYKHGRKEIQYLHPKMGDALQDTYGMMVFQENIMRVAQVLAGFSASQADTLRYAIGKKKGDLIKKMHALFVDGCAKNDINEEIAEKILEQINYFSGYGFNKSHSAAYAFLAYQMGYLKVYYPIEFMCNLLSGEINNNDKDERLDSYMKEATRMGIKIYRYHINRSGLEFTIDKTTSGEVIRMPLTGLKGVGSKAVECIVKHQPYKDMRDFISKVDATSVNSRVFATLVQSGCMDEAWRASHNNLIEQYEVAKEDVKKAKKNKKDQIEYLSKFGEGSLFDEMNPDDVHV